MKNPSKTELDKAITLRLEGYGMKEILATTGLSHSQAELAIMAYEYFIDAEGEAFEPTEANVKFLRNERISWGRISVLFGLQDDRPLPMVPESQVRKMWINATDTESVGLRIGHGGRFFDNDRTLYEENLRVTGTTLPAGEARNMEVRFDQAGLQKLIASTWEALVEQAEEHGVPVPKGAGKHAKLASAIHRKVNA